MKTFRRILVALAAAGLWAGAAAAADFESEFLKKPWGAPLSEFHGYVNVGGTGKIGYYIHPRQAYSVFGAELSELVFGFYEDRFFAVYATLDAIDTYGALRRQIQQRLGTPKISMEARGGLTVYSWRTGETRIKLKSYETTGAMKLSFYYLPLARRVNAELQKDFEDEPPEPLFPLSKTRQKEALELLELFAH